MGEAKPRAVTAEKPVVEPLTAKTPSGASISMEQFLIDVAKELKMPGFGANAFNEGGSLDTREDYYLKMVANIAYDATFQSWQNGAISTLGPVPDGSAEDLALITAIKKAHGRALSSDQWRKAAYVLARGGRFENYEAAYLPNPASAQSLTQAVSSLILDTGIDRWSRAPKQIAPAEMRASFVQALSVPIAGQDNPQWMSYQYGQGGVPCQIYNPDVATARNAITGETFIGTATYRPMRDMTGRLLEDLDPISAYPFVLSTHKTTVLSHSQGILDPWLTELMPESFIDISPDDARKFGLNTGDLVRVWSSTLPRERAIVGRLRTLPGVRVGVIAFPHGYGHWQSGASTVIVNGNVIGGDPERSVPVRLNAVIRLDTSIAAPDGWAVGCMDPVAGGQAYLETRVALERV